MAGAIGGTGSTPNVIKYYGSLMEGPRVWIIMEYAEGGSIRTLASNRSSNAKFELKNVVKSSAVKGATYLLDHEGDLGRAGVPA